MTPKTTGLLALVALGLGAFVFFHVIEGDRTRQAATLDAKNIYVGLDATEIEAVMLTTRDGIAARFERIDGRWELVSPIRARADATALDAITHALANMPREGTVEAAGPLDGFGLGPSAETVRFEIAGKTRGLRMGRSTPVGGHRYVARLGDDEVAYVASYRVNAFNRKLDDLRDRRIFQFEAGDIGTLRVSWSSGVGGQEMEVAMARDREGQWQIGVPLVGPADQEVVRDLLSNLAYLRADGFLDEPGARYDTRYEEALKETAIRFHWTVDGAHLEREARVAGEVEGQRVIETPSGLYTISAERLDDFPRTVVDYRFKQVSSFEVSAARRLELEFAIDDSEDADETGTAASDIERGGSHALRVVAELGEVGWSSGAPAIDPDRASRLVRELASLRAVDIFADEMGPTERSSLGLDPPRARIRVNGVRAGADSSGPLEVLADVVLGRFDPARGVFAQRGDAPTIFLLSSAVANDLPISAEHYRSEFEVAARAEADARDLDSIPDESGGFDSSERLEDLERP